MSTATTSFGIVKIISEIDGTGQRDEVFLTVDETQSIFDCLVEKFGASKYWTKLRYRKNGVDVICWRAIAQSGALYPAPKSRLDEHFQKLFTKQDRPMCEIYLRHTDQRRAVLPVQW